ncbi:amino acid ABC transporter permease [Oribacterium sp. HCP28S3_H8]|uniref:amino acid ABC transporter permease n=1 Tax=Oribacterium sp. HCP28S3_H8 TaxID=3438945 RepID=UPI0030329F8E|nr:amino acid ABC transporter permease [Oribacterium sp.]
MDWTFIQEYIPMYVEAGKLTLTIGILGIILSILIGMIASAIEYYKIPVLRQIVSIYVELSRNTPLLVQLFFLYFGLPKIGIRWSSELCGIVGLSFLGGSYMTEAFRSGLETVEPIQKESALSLGFTPLETMIDVILPQALAVTVPSLVANVIFLIKETSVFSGIALADLMYVAKDLIGLYYKTPEALSMLVLAYLIILLPVSIIGTLLERRLRYAGFGN